MSEKSMNRDEIMALTGRNLNVAVELIFGSRRWLKMTYSDGGIAYTLIQPDVVAGIGAMGDASSVGYEWVDAPDSTQGSISDYCADYSTDANACRLMEAEIERRGLYAGYIDALATFLDLCPAGAWWYFNDLEAFRLMTTPLDLKCRAALLAVMETKEANNAE